MWGMFVSSMRLFLRGKLFREPRLVARLSCIGAAIAAALLVGLALAGAPLVVALVVAALVAGALQPYLFKNLKFD